MPRFSAINPNKSETLAEILRRRERKNQAFYKKVDKALAKLPLSKKQRFQLENIIGTRPESCNLLASNRIGRSVLNSIAVARVNAEAQESQASSFHLATIFTDQWNCTNLTTFLDLDAMLQTSRKIVDAMGVEAAIGMIEFQAMGRDEGNGVRTIFPNAHILVRASSGFQPRVVAKKLSARFGLECALGAPPVHISDRLKTDADIARVTDYMVKAPDLGKLCVPTKRGLRFRGTASGMHQSICLRLTEIMSHLCLNELMFAYGDWVPLRRKIFMEVLLHRDFQKSRTFPSGPKCPAQFWVGTPRTDVAADCPVYVNRRVTEYRPSRPPQIDHSLTYEERRERRAVRARNRRLRARKSSSDRTMQLLV